jgi:hypothetical protein
VSEQTPFFIGQIDQNRQRLFEGSMNGQTPDVPIQDIFTLYRRAKVLLDMYKAFVPQCVPFNDAKKKSH